MKYYVLLHIYRPTYYILLATSLAYVRAFLVGILVLELERTDEGKVESNDDECRRADGTILVIWILLSYLLT